MDQTKDKFKNTQGNRYTRALFYETTGEDKETVLYTLKERKHKGYPSLKELYLETEDITEYVFANKYLDGYEHWVLLRDSDWFNPFYLLWREELLLKLEARYIKELEDLVATGGKEAPSAVKTLLERVRKAKERVKVGRPRSRSPQEEKTTVRASNSDLAHDLQVLAQYGKKEEN